MTLNGEAIPFYSTTTCTGPPHGLTQIIIVTRAGGGGEVMLGY